MVYLLGVDDAGRGPIIGPMVIAGVILNEENEFFLKKLGVKDSKQLSQYKRKKIIESLENKINYFFQIISPKEIDSSNNLNILEAEIMAIVINKLSLEKKDEKIRVFVDCPSNNKNKWSDLLKNLIIRKDLEFFIEHKADITYPVVSTASIFAKEKREEEIYKIKKEYNVEFGSGYPSDPLTISFIEKNFKNKKYENIIRYSWESIKRLIQKEKQQKLF